MLSRSLTSFTSGGLGNRIRALLGGLALAKMQGRKFYYVWRVDKKFSASMTDLWDFKYPLANESSAWFLHKLGVKRYDAQLPDLDLVNRQRHIQISTIHELRPPILREKWREELRSLRPIPAVQERIRRTWASGLSEGAFVSVMIRAHEASHEKTRINSPVEWYLHRMEELAKNNNDLIFFLSTDSPEVEIQIKQHFDRVVVQENKGEFNSLEGLQAAVADLYLLASSIYMLKPYWSSFPEMAQALAGTDFLAEDSRSEDLFKDGKLNMKLPNDPIKPFLKDCLYNQGYHKSFD